MQLTMSVEILAKAEACGEAVTEFRKMFGESVTVEWTREKQIEIMRGSLGKYLGWAWRNNLIPWWNLSGADLLGAYLSGEGVDISGAKVCVCDASACVSLRELLAANGYTVDKHGLLAKQVRSR